MLSLPLLLVVLSSLVSFAAAESMTMSTASTMLATLALLPLTAAAPLTTLTFGNLNSAPFTLVVVLIIIVYILAQWVRFWSFDNATMISRDTYLSVRQSMAGGVVGVFGWFTPWAMAIAEYIGRVLLVIAYILFVLQTIVQAAGEPAGTFATWWVAIAVSVAVAAGLSQLGGACFWQLSQYAIGGFVDFLEAIAWIIATIFLFLEIFQAQPGQVLGFDIFLVIITAIWIFFALWRMIDKCAFASAARYSARASNIDVPGNLIPATGKGVGLGPGSRQTR
jgi:hypothetical protein